MAGRTKSSKVTMADTGLPGRPNTGKAPLAPAGMVPNVPASPGLMLTSHRCCSAPSRPSAALTRSCSPTDTPADEMRRSQPSPQESRSTMSSSRSRAIPRLTGSARARQIHELVARGEDAHDRPPHHPHRLMPERGEQADLGRPQHAPALEHDITQPHVLAPGPHALPGRHETADPDRAAIRRHVFLRDDAVGALGERRAGEDAEGLAGPEPPLGHASRRHAPPARE